MTPIFTFTNVNNPNEAPHTINCSDSGYRGQDRGGAGGSLGSAAVAKADPDGYTLLINAAAHSGAPAAYPNLPYDAAADFAGVAILAACRMCCWWHRPKASSPCRNWWPKRKTGRSTFLAGVGSATHWAAERFIVSAGFKATHVPFRGGPEALAEDMTGRVDFIFIGISSGLPFIQNKQLVPLAVSSAKRSPTLPDLPTTLEAGYKDSDFNYWNGMLVPAKTPGPIIEGLHAETTKALALPDVQQKLTAQGVEPAPLQSGRNGRHHSARDRTQPEDSERSRTQIQLNQYFRGALSLSHRPTTDTARTKQCVCLWMKVPKTELSVNRYSTVAHRQGRCGRISLHASSQFC